MREYKQTDLEEIKSKQEAQARLIKNKLHVDVQRLEAELAWLQAEVYGRRQARLPVEELDSRVRYSARAGLVSERTLSS